LKLFLNKNLTIVEIDDIIKISKGKKIKEKRGKPNEENYILLRR
jgi:hypothetical protein